MLMTQRPGPYARPQKDPQAPATAKLAGLPLVRTGISGGFDDLGLFDENDPARTSPGQRRAGGAIRGASGRAQELPGTRSQALVDAVLSTRSVASLLHGVRHRAMEDMHSVHTDDECVVVGVYDGHGGVEAARHCRDTLPPLVLGELRGDGCSDTTMQRVLAEAFTRCDAELVDSQRGEVEGLETAEESPPTGNCAGSTALLVALHRGGRCLNIAWAGDCRAVLCRAGSHVQLTTDHRADCPREAARVVREGGEVVDGRLDGYLEVSRAFGDLDRATKAKPAGLSAKAEVRSFGLTPKDEFVILATDGLWDVLTPAEAVSIARSTFHTYGAADMVAERLVEAAVTRHTDDDIAIVILPLFPPPCALDKESATAFTRLPTTPKFVRVVGGF